MDLFPNRWASHAPRNAWHLVWRMNRQVLPLVDHALTGWRKRISDIPNAELRAQALASISTKAFHCQGGSAYASLDPANSSDLVELIVAFQTISDYLDNLCDRSVSMEEADFRALHQAMLDAVNPLEDGTYDYYQQHPNRNDGGYLRSLVQTCQHQVRKLSSYALVQNHIQKWVGWYADLQVYKHLKPESREPRLLAWWETHQSATPSLRWNEFAAATGSTLGVFMMFALAAQSDLTETAVERCARAYFPWICSVHILLDYVIDQEEDRIGGDLNFCTYYQSQAECMERLEWLVAEARAATINTPADLFHKMIIEGLIAVYLSDPKADQQQSVRSVRQRIMRNSPLMRIFFWFNTKWVRLTRPQSRFE